MPSPKAPRNRLIGFALVALSLAIAWVAAQWLITGHPPFFKIGTGDVADFEIDDATLVSWSNDPGRVADGLARYTAFCGACHGDDLTATLDGNPLPALSLADGEWKYGARPSEIHAFISRGTPPDSPGHNGLKMLPWGEILNPSEIAEIVAYILSRNRAAKIVAPASRR